MHPSFVTLMRLTGLVLVVEERLVEDKAENLPGYVI